MRQYIITLIAIVLIVMSVRGNFGSLFGAVITPDYMVDV